MYDPEKIKPFLLHPVALVRDFAADFADRLRKLRDRHGKKRTLIGLLKKAGLSHQSVAT